MLVDASGPKSEFPALGPNADEKEESDAVCQLSARRRDVHKAPVKHTVKKVEKIHSCSSGLMKIGRVPHFRRKYVNRVAEEQVAILYSCC